MGFSRAVGIGLWAFKAVVCDAQQFQARLDLRVLDQIGLPPSVRSGAITTTGAVLDRVGISTRWRVCDVTHRSTECTLPFSASEISIRMLARPADPHQTGLAVSIVTLADGMGVYSVVFHDRIVDAARRASCKPSLMLGYVMAHELGHLLGLKHARRGIMKSTFSDKEMRLASQGLLVFQEQERRELRAVANGLDHSILPATN